MVGVLYVQSVTCVVLKCILCGFCVLSNVQCVRICMCSLACVLCIMYLTLLVCCIAEDTYVVLGSVSCDFCLF